MASVVNTFTVDEYKEEFKNKNSELEGIIYIKKYLPTENSTL